MHASQTWMAGCTKVALIFKQRFWRLESSNLALATSKCCPAFQVYDSSHMDGSVSALTFFALVKPDNQAALQSDQVLVNQVATQISTVWKHSGHHEAATQVLKFVRSRVQRWPNETYLSEDNAPTQINPHPLPVKSLSQPEWSGMLHFAGSETDLVAPGFMEGAVGAANRVLQELKNFCQATSTINATKTKLQK